MDVLAYSAFNQQARLNQELATKQASLDTKCTETAQKVSEFNSAGTETCWVKCIEPSLLRNPAQTNLWSCIPDLIGATGGFKVCNTASQFNCGFCCQWTVPAGVTCARFQLWGAGGGSDVGYCCGGSPFGSTGAYASVIIPVTAGCTYTICSGCAEASRNSTNNYSYTGQRIPGCPSWVQGPGLCNFCANGGQGRLGNWMAAYGHCNPYRISLITQGDAGACICTCGTSYCFSNSCATCGEIPHVAGASYFGTTTSETSPSIVYGIRGMWPRICFDTNHFGYQVHAPIYGFINSSQCCGTWTSSSICGAPFCAASGFLQIPGAGGYFSINMGGCRCLTGDIGRMGMVCVSFC